MAKRKQTARMSTGANKRPATDAAVAAVQDDPGPPTVNNLDIKTIKRMAAGWYKDKVYRCGNLLFVDEEHKKLHDVHEYINFTRCRISTAMWRDDCRSIIRNAVLLDRCIEARDKMFDQNPLSPDLNEEGEGESEEDDQDCSAYSTDNEQEVCEGGEEGEEEEDEDEGVYYEEEEDGTIVIE